MTWDASQEFESGDLLQAERAYRAILDSFPGDPAAKVNAGAMRRSTRDDLICENPIARGLPHSRD
jgi:hypothetical protein